MTESASARLAPSTSKGSGPRLRGSAAQTLGMLLGLVVFLGPLYIVRPVPPPGVLSPAACPLNVPFTPGTWFVLHDIPPQAQWFLPLLSTANEPIGTIGPDHPARICGSIFHSTWNSRNLWFHVQVDEPDSVNGWIRTSAPSLASFLRSYDLSSGQ